MSDAVRELIDRNEITDTITRLFIGTDQRDWTGVENCFAEVVDFDMTSLAGGEPRRLTAGEIITGWEEALRPVESIHHQMGNFLVTLMGDEAVAFCYGIASHHRKVESGRNTRTFVGSYNFHLRRNHSRWRIDSFRFNVKFVEGNLGLDTDSPSGV